MLEGSPNVTSTRWAQRCMVLSYQRGSQVGGAPGPGSRVSASRTRQGAVSMHHAGGPSGRWCSAERREPEESGLRSQPTAHPRPFAAVSAVLPSRAKRKQLPVCSGSSCGRSPLTAQLWLCVSTAHRHSLEALRSSTDGREGCAPITSGVLPGARPLPAAALPASPPRPRSGEAAGVGLIATAPDGSGHTEAQGAVGCSWTFQPVSTTAPGRALGAISHQPAPLASVAWYPSPAARGLRALLAAAAKVLSLLLVVGAQPVRQIQKSISSLGLAPRSIFSWGILCYHHLSGQTPACFSVQGCAREKAREPRAANGRQMDAGILM